MSLLRRDSESVRVNVETRLEFLFPSISLGVDGTTNDRSLALSVVLLSLGVAVEEDLRVGKRRDDLRLLRSLRVDVSLKRTFVDGIEVLEDRRSVLLRLSSAAPSELFDRIGLLLPEGVLLDLRSFFAVNRPLPLLG